MRQTAKVVNMRIERDSYLKQLIDSMWNGQVKVITGLRRCGKSYLLDRIFREYLYGKGVPEADIISLDLDQLQFANERNPLNLANYIRQKLGDDKKKRYLFIDEIQRCEPVPNPALPQGGKITFYDVLNEFRVLENLDIYVTGSNSKMLSTDILTDFRGRGDEIRVHPLSFAEYFSVAGGDKRDALETYLIFGGMPHAALLSTDEAKMRYLKGLFDEVYLKDIFERKQIERGEVLDATLDLLSSAIGSLTNPNKIANVLTTKLGIAVNTTTVRTYVEYLKDAFLFAEAKRYDVRGKAYFDYPNKYYCEDVGLRNARTGFREIDQPHLMENVIYNELIRRGFAVDVGVVPIWEKNTAGNAVKKTCEIDFVVNKGAERVYIQSAYRMDDEEKSAQEVRPLLLTGDAFRRIVIRGDIGRRSFDQNGILHIALTDFLIDSNIV